MGTNCVFLFVYRCMLWAILCFASITFLPGIASPTSDLNLVIAGHSKTLQNGTHTISPHESCHQDAPTEGPDFPSLERLPAHAELFTVRHMPPGNRIGWAPYYLQGGHTSQGQDECSPKMGSYLAGRGVLRSDTLCYFVAPCLPMQFSGHNWEDTPHTVTYTTVTNMPHARAHTQSITRKQTNSRYGNKDRAGVTGDMGRVWR